MNTTTTTDGQPTVTWVLEARFKELTDEEIIEVIEQSPIADDIGMYRTGIEFARAILRKAQEK